MLILEGDPMLRIEVNEEEDFLVMRLYGRLTGEYDEQIRMLLTRCHPKTALLVDLTELTYVDSAGEEVLSSIAQLPRGFVAENSYAKHLCDRLKLPLAKNKRCKRKTKAAAQLTGACRSLRSESKAPGEHCN